MKIMQGFHDWKLIPLILITWCFSACSFTPVNSSKLNRLQNPSQSTAFTQNWPFDATSTASYSFNASTMDFTGGVCRLTATNQTDNSNACTGFGDGVTPSCGGSYTGVTWDTTNNFVRLSASTNTSELDLSWAPQPSSLAAVWHLNEIAGTSGPASVIDSSIHANHGAPVGSPVFGVSAKLRTGVTFNGTDAGIVAPLVTSQRNDVSISAWVAPNITSQPLQSLIVLNGTDTGGYGLMLNKLGNDYGELWILFPAINIFNTAYTFPDTNWHHVVLTISNTNLCTVYIDGRSVYSQNNGLPNLPAHGTTIGIEQTTANVNQQFYKGALDEVAVWTKALTATEVQTIYSRQAAKYSGTFTSRVMDAFQSGMSWTTFSWVPTLPFYKELSDAACSPGPTCVHANSESSTDYGSLVGSAGNVGDDNLMSGIAALWHLDEAAGTNGAGSVKDNSGQGKDGTPANVTFGGLGRFLSSASFNGISSTIQSSNALAQANNFSLSVWVAANLQSQPSYGTILSVGRDNLNNGVALILNNTGPSQGLVSIRFAGIGTTDTTYILPDSNWHHLVYVLTSANTSILYADGKQVYNASIGQPVAPTNLTTIGAIGVFTGGFSHYFMGSIDEVGIWSRALDPKEVLQLYRRGANRVKFQVRICTTPNAGKTDCTDDPTGTKWKGPDGTTQTYFSELNNMSVQAAVSSGSVLKTLPSMYFPNFTLPPGTSQYFQYRAILESDDTGTNCNYGGATWCSPELKSVKVDPVHYDNSSPTVVGKTGVAFKSLSNFLQTAGAGGCAGGTGYNLGVGASSAAATWYWWSGAAWVVANGTAAQSNTAAVVATNAPSFAGVAGTGTVYFKAYLKSDGTQACELDNVELDGVQ